MSKEIKFRAWDKTLFKMFEPRTLRDIAKEAPNNGVNWYQFELMQFTGLTDKNCKDIYEGDIVSGVLYKDYSEHIGKVLYDFNGYRILTNEKSLQLDLPEKLSVIGNIYEHGHLLKG